MGMIQRLELVQWSFLRKINGQKGKNYWECLREMGVYSLQRRRERYRMIYTWKIMEGLVPNVNSKIQSRNHIRLGRLCTTEHHNAKVRKVREGSFTISGPRLFNSLPKHVRNLRGTSVEKFKNTLDAYLRLIPDEPQIPGYTESRRADSNEVPEMQKKMSCIYWSPR